VPEAAVDLHDDPDLEVGEVTRTRSGSGQLPDAGRQPVGQLDVTDVPNLCGALRPLADQADGLGEDPAVGLGGATSERRAELGLGGEPQLADLGQQGDGPVRTVTEREIQSRVWRRGPRWPGGRVHARRELPTPPDSYAGQVMTASAEGNEDLDGWEGQVVVIGACREAPGLSRARTGEAARRADGQEGSDDPDLPVPAARRRQVDPAVHLEPAS